MPKHVSTLAPVPLRDVWSDEAAEFTPWLADNLPRMLEELGLAHDILGTEQPVGRYRADIVFTDGETGDLVLVENQLNRTDHSHLGQILTYAAGLDAATVIWVAQSFTDEHRAALDWLNESTHDTLSFIGIEVELWRIDESAPAPRFNVVAKPNEWTRSIRRATREGLSETRVMQVEYWRALRERIVADQGLLKMTDRDRPRGWARFAIGRTGFHLTAVMQRKEKSIRAELYIKGQSAKEYFSELQVSAAEIEKELGYGLKWELLPEGLDCRVCKYQEADPDDRDDWERQHAWLKKTLQEFHSVLGPRVRALESR